MPAHRYIDIEPAVLTWALGHTDAVRRMRAEQKTSVRAWVTKEKKPTVKQLADLAKKLAVPFGYLLLSEPPETRFAHAYFRRGIAADPGGLSADARDLVASIDQRSAWMEDYLADLGVDPLPFVGSVAVEDQPASAAAEIAGVVPRDTSWTPSPSSWSKAKTSLIASIESAGIFVAASGVVGNNTHRTVDPEEVNGFSIVRPRAPFIFINSADYIARQVFTLAHELAHVWLGDGAVDQVSFELKGEQEKVESWCNLVASYYLVPDDQLSDLYAKGLELQNLAVHFGISPFAVNRALYDRNLIHKNTYTSNLSELRTKINSTPNIKGKGGNYFATVPVRTSKRFISYIRHAYSTNQIDYRGASRLIDVRGKSFNKLMAT